MNELVVVVCPILTSKIYLVLKEGKSIPIVRSSLQEIYSPILTMSGKELKGKAPVYNEKEILIDFSSRKDANFTLRSLVNSYDDGDDPPKINFTLDSSENERLNSKFKHLQ